MTFSDYIDYLRDKRIGVIGFGVSNQPLVRVLLRNGCDVTVCDRRERRIMRRYAIKQKYKNP